MNHIIINADDFGMSKEVNEGIKQGIEAGVINSVSVMVNMPYFKDAISFLKKHPEIAVGLHFNITEGFPSSTLNKVSTLVREDGNFFHWGTMIINLLTQSASLHQIEKELFTQYEKLKKTRLAINHMDSHHHIHLYSSIFKIFLAFALGHNVKTLRGRIFKISHIFSSMRKIPSLKQFIILTMCFINNILFNHKKRFYEINKLYDINWDSNFNEKKFLQLLQTLPNGVVEIICHPAVLTKTGNLKFLKPRYKELSLLLNPKVQRAIKKYSRSNLIETEFYDSNVLFSMEKY